MRFLRTTESTVVAQGGSQTSPLHAPGYVICGLSWAECFELHEYTFQDGLVRAIAVDAYADLPGPGVDVIAVLSPEVFPLFPASAEHLFHGSPWHDTWATILLPWREPPQRSIRADGTVESFCCSTRVFSELLTNARVNTAGSLCLCLLDAIMNGKVVVQQLLVKQLPLDSPCLGPAPLTARAAVIMAHRGPKRFLEAALRSIARVAGASQVTVRVGLDLEDVGDYQDVFETFPEVEFYQVEGAPVGPYVIRQALIDRLTEQLITFHDSDDISCHDRIAAQAAEISARHVEVVGSHELRVDEIDRCVKVFRFPLDASAALALPGSTERNDRAKEPLLHPTATMVRSGFVQAGGFSTDQRIANDTQFMLRAYFSLGMRNVDNFLYIRRRHPGALTVARETALGTPLRHHLGTLWGDDFEAVKSGKAKLEETSLQPRSSPVPHRLVRIARGEG